MPYARFTLFYFDTGEKDAMLAGLIPQLDAMAKEVSGAIRERLTQVAENRMVVHSVYENKEAADAAADRANGIRDSIAEFMTEQPMIREGEIIWDFHGDDQSLTTEIGHYAKEIISPGYVTHRATDIDPSKYDALIPYLDRRREQFRRVSGLTRLRVARIAGDRVVATAIYDNKASSDAGQENAKGILAGGSEFFTGNVVFLEGYLIWSSSN